jgi:hypothetical protein
MSKKPAGPRFAPGEHLLVARQGHFEPAEVIGSTGRAPWLDNLLLRFGDGTQVEHEMRGIYRPGPAFDAYLAAWAHYGETLAQYDANLPAVRHTRLAMAEAENKAFCSHPAGAFWRAHHNW